MPSDIAAMTHSRDRLVFAIKWGASAIQIMGYTATGFGWTPWNLYLFLIGVVGWFAVGAFWNDKALMLVHLVALGAMLAGMASG
ncbi:ubiquinone biosynthesis methyltransferase UbiE [Roseovarius aestuarii]|nr:ubiquinone biosynthesis methyltransferase UbiE [Roseovarius aestuarii]